jgi:hypothetical protein
MKEGCVHDRDRRPARHGPVHLSDLRAYQAREVLTGACTSKTRPSTTLFQTMNDLIYLVVFLVFFALTTGFTIGLDRI